MAIALRKPLGLGEYTLYDNADDIAYGTLFRDRMNLMGGLDTAYGSDLGDYIRAGYGNDVVYGEDENDKLIGEDGDDCLFGGSGNDRIYGGLGMDFIQGGDGNDVLYGGVPGQGSDGVKDIFDFDSDDGFDRVFGMDAFDRINFNGSETLRVEFNKQNDDVKLFYGNTTVVLERVGFMNESNYMDYITFNEAHTCGGSTQPEPVAVTYTTDAVVPATGQTVVMQVDTFNGTVDGTLPVDVTVGLPGVQASNINIAYIFDESGSIDTTEHGLETDALIALTQSYIDSGFTNAQVDIASIPFAGAATVEGVFDPADPASLTDVNPALEAALQTRNFSGSTNFEAALRSAVNYFETYAQTGDTNIVYFISDGYGSGSYADELATLNSVFNAQILAFGVGTGADITALSTIDNTGGAETLLNIADLASEIVGSPISGADVDFFEFKVNGAVVAGIDESVLVATPFGYSLNGEVLTGLGFAAGDDNDIMVTVSFDDVDDTTLTLTFEADSLF